VGQLFIQTYTNQTTSWLVRNWSTFNARTNHEHTQIHKIHHGPNLGETTTFSLIVFYVVNHKGCTQMSSSPEIPEIGSPEIFEILKIGILATLEAHNFFLDL